MKQDTLAIYSRGSRTSAHLHAVACTLSPERRQWQRLDSDNRYPRSLDLFAELCGIVAGLELAQTVLEDESYSKVIIFSNSQDAIRYMSCPIKQRHPYLFDLIESHLRTLTTPVRLVWIPSKTGIAGNKHACRLVWERLMSVTAPDSCGTPNSALARPK